jgi:drug/metabolite transporter (DMT)-like permease
MIACPGCKRRVVTHREMLQAGLDGRLTCPACGELACLDETSRCLVTAVLALLLWMLLLHGNFFFSGYVFIVSTIVIVIGWRLLSAAALPLLSLAKAPGHGSLDRRQNIVTLAILIVTAIVIDGLMTYRSDADKRQATATSVSESARSQ